LTRLQDPGPLAIRKRIDFGYDSQSRRQWKKVSLWNGSTYVGSSTNRFIYDQWNLLGEWNHTNGLINGFVWGIDLSGTLQGAGGVGGLLLVNNTAKGVRFAVSDANGNVSLLLNAANGTEAARYEYGPFGELLRASSSTALLNPIRFSSKYHDDETDMLYYGYRYYGCNTGRWLNRDPIEERDLANLYCFVGNNPISIYDRNGQERGMVICPGCGRSFMLSDGADFKCPHCGWPPAPPPPDPTGFALCTRDVNPEGVIEHGMLIGFRILHPQTPTDHAYLHYKRCNDCERVGWGIGGTKPGAPPILETKFNPTDCKPCKKTDSLLQYGAPGRKGTEATDSEILDCISSVPTSKKYVPTGKGQYNCMNWAVEAASKCGLDCSGSKSK
jgi:RHS repeat-associated protein